MLPEIGSLQGLWYYDWPSLFKLIDPGVVSREYSFFFKDLVSEHHFRLVSHSHSLWYTSTKVSVFEAISPLPSQVQLFESVVPKEADGIRLYSQYMEVNSNSQNSQDHYLRLTNGIFLNEVMRVMWVHTPWIIPIPLLIKLCLCTWLICENVFFFYMRSKNRFIMMCLF